MFLCPNKSLCPNMSLCQNMSLCPNMSSLCPNICFVFVRISSFLPHQIQQSFCVYVNLISNSKKFCLYVTKIEMSSFLVHTDPDGFGQTFSHLLPDFVTPCHTLCQTLSRLVPDFVTPCTRLFDTLYQTLSHLVPDFVTSCTWLCHILYQTLPTRCTGTPLAGSRVLTNMKAKFFLST